MAYRQSQGLVEDFFGVGLTSRKNLCLNPKVSKEKKGKVVDSKCRNLTASWVRAKAGVNKAGGNQQAEEGDDPMDVDQQRNDVELCNFYEVSVELHGKLQYKNKLIGIFHRLLKLLIHQILFQMVYIHLKTLKLMVKKCNIVHIILYDEQ